MHTLGCLLAIIFGLFWFIASAIMNIWNTAFGSPGTKTREKKQWGYSAGYQAGSGAKPNSRQRRRKLFEDNEGEYVDFVEVKD